MDPRDMGNSDRIDAAFAAQELVWALDDYQIKEAHAHFAQVARSMGYRLEKREPLPSISQTLGDI